MAPAEPARAGVRRRLARHRADPVGHGADPPPRRVGGASPMLVEAAVAATRADDRARARSSRRRSACSSRRTCRPCSSRWASSPTRSRRSSWPVGRRSRTAFVQALVDAIVRFRESDRRRRRRAACPSAMAVSHRASLALAADRGGRRRRSAVGRGAYAHRGRAPRSRRGGAGTDGSGAARRAGKIKARLFYVADDGMRLTSVERDVPFGEGAAEQARRIVEAQLAPAPTPLVSAIPPGTTLRALFVARAGRGLRRPQRRGRARAIRAARSTSCSRSTPSSTR